MFRTGDFDVKHNKASFETGSCSLVNMDSFRTQNGADKEFGLATSTQTLGLRSTSSTVALHKDNKRSRLALLIVCFVLLVACIVLTVLLVLESRKIDENKKYGVTCKETPSKEEVVYCSSGACLGAASKLQKKLNNSVDPCEDFFEYACGSWIKNNPIPSSENQISTFRKTLKLNNEKMLLMLLENDDLPNGHAVSKAKVYFKSCMNEDDNDNTTTFKLRRLINQFGSWPLGDATWNESTWNQVEGLLKMQRDLSDISPLFKIDVDTNPYNSSRFILQVPWHVLKRKITLYSMKSSSV